MLNTYSVYGWQILAYIVLGGLLGFMLTTFFALIIYNRPKTIIVQDEKMSRKQNFLYRVVKDQQRRINALQDSVNELASVKAHAMVNDRITRKGGFKT